MILSLYNHFDALRYINLNRVHSDLKSEFIHHLVDLGEDLIFDLVTCELSRWQHLLAHLRIALTSQPTGVETKSFYVLIVFF